MRIPGEIHPCSHPELTRKVALLPSRLGGEFNTSAVFATYPCPVHEGHVHVAAVVAAKSEYPGKQDVEALVFRLRFAADQLEAEYLRRTEENG